jgi:PD-(D/E)XK nuclease superfamily
MLAARRTVVVHTILAGRMLRTEAARKSEVGVQILTMGQVAARLAGGLLRPVDLDVLIETVTEVLPTVDMGELDPIKDLPGMPSAVVGTFEKAWRAGIDLAAETHPRIAALATLEQEVVQRLPASMKRPEQLVQLAMQRTGHAAKVIGPLEIHGHSEMSPCWRPLLRALAKVIPVTWVAGPRHIPAWLGEIGVKIATSAPTEFATLTYSCANQQHEVVEAFRWMRKLLAEGVPAADIAIAATSPGEYDDHVFAQSADSSLPVHFVSGIRALTTADGQAAAALAEVLAKGLSQERVRRLFALLRASPALADIPPEWSRLLPADAPLTELERWEQVFRDRDASDWPDGRDCSAAVLQVLRLLDRGLDVATDIDEALLSRGQLGLWRRALREGPAAALPVTLTGLRVSDGLDPAISVIWCSAIDLASSPRPHVWLIGLNAGRWPRRISEDRLIPDHVLSIEKLDPLPIADGDKRDFATILATAVGVSISFSRRDAGGRMLGRSPLVGGFQPVYLDRSRTPEHAASEADRLLGRPAEFEKLPVALSGIGCWNDWYRSKITAHDGLIAKSHPRLHKLFERPLSATSMKLLLRDPIRFVWRYALGWKAPEDADEPLTLDNLAFGNFVHGLLRTAVDELQNAGGLATADPETIKSEISKAVLQTAKEWESEYPVPPGVIWTNSIERARTTATAALTYPLPPLVGQQTWTEIPFGKIEKGDNSRDLPWRSDQAVEIPGTGFKIEGQIDRLDLAGDRSHARVLDYKTGKLNKKMADVVIKGGAELQRCLYAFAVKTLIGKIGIQAALLFPHAEEGGQALFPLDDLDAALTKVAEGLTASRDALLAGHAVPGIDAKDAYNDLAFALPANATYLPRKTLAAEACLGAAITIWNEP